MYQLYDLLVYQEKIRPNAPFLMLSEKIVSYGEIFLQTEALKKTLVNLGLHVGERVAISCEHLQDYIVALFACWASNTTAVPVEAKLNASAQNQMLDISKVHWILSSEKCSAGSIHAKRVRPYEYTEALSEGVIPAQFLFTSGSTGAPKAVMLSHQTLLCAAIESVDSIRLTPEDIQLTTVPFWHAYGQNRGLLSTVYSGASIVPIFEDDIKAKLFALKNIDPTILISMPSFYGLLSGIKPILGQRLRLAISGAAPLAPAIRKRFEQIYNVPLMTSYGLTECQVIACMRLDIERPLGAVGYPIRGVHLRLIGEDGKEVNSGQQGRVLVKGHNVMMGYFERDNEKVIMDGWFDTQDIGKIDETGALHLVGRESTFIKRSGIKVYPIEIQNFLINHPNIIDATVTRYINSIGSEELMVQVVLQAESTLDESDLLKYCEDNLPPYKVPLKYKIVPKISQLASGKPDVSKIITEQEI